LLEKCGVDQKEFFKEAGRLVGQGWDPPLAYLSEIIKNAQDGGQLSKFREAFLKELALSCEDLFFPGTEDLFDRLKKFIKDDAKFNEIGIQVSCYIISGGIEEFIRETPVGLKADGVWASSFDYDEKGRPVAIKNVMSFTEKTRYIFCINKGVEVLARSSPYMVNTDEPDRKKRAVPFSNMIYIGDGPSDIPCMSLITLFKGRAIGILGERAERAWELGFGRRSNITIPPDFREDKVGYTHLRKAVQQVAESIRIYWDGSIGSFPSY
jgi:hypothetical protein